MVTTRDAALAEKLRVLRVHGSKPKYYHALIGGNFRFDALQAAIVAVKLKYLDGWTAGRQANAARYRRLFEAAGLSLPSPAGGRGAGGEGLVQLPYEVPGGRHIYNQFVVRVPRRNELQAYLKEQKIGNEVYYPVPLHVQQCFAYLGHREGDFPESERAASETLALPIYPELSDQQAEYVVASIGRFLSEDREKRLTRRRRGGRRNFRDLSRGIPYHTWLLACPLRLCTLREVCLWSCVTFDVSIVFQQETRRPHAGQTANLPPLMVLSESGMLKVGSGGRNTAAQKGMEQACRAARLPKGNAMKRQPKSFSPLPSPLSPRGFTLVEMLVVIAIIGILAGLTVPAVIGALRNAKAAAVAMEINQLDAACKAYKEKFGEYPPDFAGLDNIGSARDPAARSQNVILRHLAKAFPRYQPGVTSVKDRLARLGVRRKERVGAALTCHRRLPFPCRPARWRFFLAASRIGFHGRQRRRDSCRWERQASMHKTPSRAFSASVPTLPIRSTTVPAEFGRSTTSTSTRWVG